MNQNLKHFKPVLLFVFKVQTSNTTQVHNTRTFVVSFIKFSNMCSSWRCLVWLVLTLSLLLFGKKMHCQEMNDYDQLDNPAVLPLITQLVYTRISNLTSILSQQISKDSNFCVKDP